MRFVATLNRPATLGRPPATLRRASASGEVVRRLRGAAAGSREGLRRQVQAVERRRRAMAVFRRAGLSEEEAAQRASFAS